MHTIVWRFTVKPEHVAAFIKGYGPEGAWAQLFRAHPAYKGTELLRDTTQANVFLTLDHWATPTGFDEFKAAHRDAYTRLDKQFEGMTEREEQLGIITR